jgi:hypothetical protein
VRRHEAGPEIILRDIIYFDSDRASSLASQFQQGLVREIQERSERVEGSSGKFGLSAPLRAESSSSTEHRRSRFESRIFHHDLLRILEDTLFEAGVAQDVNDGLDSSATEAQVDALREGFTSRPYLRCEGAVFLEDFARLKEITQKFNELTEMIATAGALPALLATPEGQQLEAEMQRLRLQLISLPDGQRKNKLTQDLVQLIMERRSILFAATELEETPEWLLEGIRLWIDAFAPDRISLRFYPSEEAPQFQVITHLERASFLDDLEQFRYLYGAEPDIKLTVFGLATSVPPHPRHHRFSATAAFRSEAERVLATSEAHAAASLTGSSHAVENPSDEAVFEAAFRGMFPGVEGLESMIRFARYPTVTVAPIAVYRTVRTAPTTESDRRGWFNAVLRRR